MIFLPIVDRELRVASRQRSTFWARLIAAIIALVIASGFLAISYIQSFMFGPTMLGKALFSVLTWLSLGVALSAGLFFTADCLSEEKREGTLGFLFLTDLRGYDVVLGKLLATSLRGAFALFAVFPILGMTLLMGGVTGAQFWQATLALVNALLISLAAGLFVSVLGRDSQRVMGGTLLLLVVVAGTGPLLDAIIFRHQAWLSCTSPVYVFMQAGAWGKTKFWPALMGNQVVTWTLLGATCLLLPHLWQEKASKFSLSRARQDQWWRFGGSKRRASLRARLLDVNPVLWLASRERWQAAVLWLLAAFMVAMFTTLLLVKEDGLWLTWNYFGGTLALLIYLGAASQSGRFFVDAQRSGLTEILLATPLTVKEIVKGHWFAMWRRYGWPILLCVVVQAAGSAWSQAVVSSRMAAAMPALPPATMTNGLASSNSFTLNSTVMVFTATASGPGASTAGGGATPPMGLIITAGSLAALINMVGNLVALGWFGMWMGMNSKSTGLATLKTIALVQVAPWFVINFLSAMVMPMLMLPSLMKGVTPNISTLLIWYPLIASGIAATLYLAKNLAFVLWARRKIYAEFRICATRTVAPIRMAVPPPLAAPVASLPGPV